MITLKAPFSNRVTLIKEKVKRGIHKYLSILMGFNFLSRDGTHVLVVTTRNNA